MLESDRFSSVRLHLGCAADMRDKAIKFFGESVTELDLFDELKPVWAGE